MLERASLHAGEDAGVENLAHLFHCALGSGAAAGVVEVLADEYDAAAGTSKGLVGGGSDYMGVLDGVLEQTGGDEASRVRHVDPEDGAYFVRDRAHALVVPLAGICGSAAHDKFWPVLQRQALHGVVIYPAGLGIKPVGYYIIKDARRIDRRAVGEVPAHAEVEPHHGVAGLKDGHHDRHVGLCAGVGLYVGPFRSVDGLDAVDGELFYLVNHLATAVIALARVALGVFVGADGAHGAEDVVGHVIFRGDKFQSALLALKLFLDEFK